MNTDNRMYVGFWSRVVAAIIDTILIVLLTYPFLLAIYGMAYFDIGQSGFIAGPADFLLSWVFPAVAVIVFWIKKQATPGKMVISARIVDANSGQNASNGQLIGRYFAYYLSLLPLGLGFVWVALDVRKQGWHDKLAGTVVVRSKNQKKSTVESGNG
jgi:uncharacterized RDD family membrane protein YckC